MTFIARTLKVRGNLIGNSEIAFRPADPPGEDASLAMTFLIAGFGYVTTKMTKHGRSQDSMKKLCWQTVSFI